MTVFGDLDVSVIRQCRPAAGIVTKFVTGRTVGHGMGYVRSRSRRRQAYVVCPVIGEEEGNEAQAEATERRSDTCRMSYHTSGAFGLQKSVPM